MLKRLTRSLSSPLAVESLRQDMGVGSPHTAKARLQDMVFAYLAWPCHQRDGAGPKLSAQSKYYFIDPLMARLAPLRSEGTFAEADPSAVNEQQLGLELIRLGNMGFEGKYVDAGSRREALTVRSAFGRGVLATRSLLDTSGDVWAVPAPLVAWMHNKAGEGTRTPDPLFTRQALYQLSYSGVDAGEGQTVTRRSRAV